VPWFALCVRLTFCRLCDGFPGLLDGAWVAFLGCCLARGGRGEAVFCVLDIKSRAIYRIALDDDGCYLEGRRRAPLLRGFAGYRDDRDDEAVVLRAWCGEMVVALKLEEFISSRQRWTWRWTVG
jgi:hypothetical protein